VLLLLGPNLNVKTVCNVLVLNKNYETETVPAFLFGNSVHYKLTSTFLFRDFIRKRFHPNKLSHFVVDRLLHDVTLPIYFHARFIRTSNISTANVFTRSGGHL
jgi:hypothetical protein